MKSKLEMSSVGVIFPTLPSSVLRVLSCSDKNLFTSLVRSAYIATPGSNPDSKSYPNLSLKSSSVRQNNA